MRERWWRLAVGCRCSETLSASTALRLCPPRGSEKEGGRCRRSPSSRPSCSHGSSRARSRARRRRSSSRDPSAAGALPRRGSRGAHSREHRTPSSARARPRARGEGGGLREEGGGWQGLVSGRRRVGQFRHADGVRWVNSVTPDSAPIVQIGRLLEQMRYHACGSADDRLPVGALASTSNGGDSRSTRFSRS